MPDIGNTLREARIRKGLSISDVESVTKIRSKYLEALEENDFEVLPGPTVVKGFLRSYALFLKLDPDLLIAEYRTNHEYFKEEPLPLRTDLTQQPRTRTTAERRKRRTQRTHRRGYAAAGIIAVVVVALLAWFGTSRGEDSVTLDSSNFPTSVSTATTLAVLSTTTSSTPASSTTSVTGVPTTTGQDVEMVLTVSEGSCWLVVRDDSEAGAELYAGTLSAGGQQTFNSSKRYWMMVGIPEVLTVAINGTAYSLTGPAGSFLVTETGVERVD